MHRFLQSSSFWKARCVLIGQLSSALWLAKYLKLVTEMLCSLPYCDAMSQCDETKATKPIINEAFVASSGDIITDYNAYRISRRANIKPCLHLWSEKQQTTSATLHCSKLMFESSVANSLNIKTYLQAVSQKRQTVLSKLELPHFIETTFVRCTHLNTWLELFWNSVVNTT